MSAKLFEIAKPKPNQTAIEALEEMLALAREGKVESVLVAAVMTGGAAFWLSSDAQNVTTLIGAAKVATDDLVMECLSRAEC